MSETVQKHLDKANSAWQELAVTFGGPRRRTMICRMLRYLVVTATLFYCSRNFASTSIRTFLGGPSEWKEFALQRANGPVQSQSQTRADAANRVEIRWNAQIKAGE